MATSMYGNIEPFRPDTEGGFSTNMEREELFFTANGVAEEKQVPVFLSCVGSAVYGLLRNLLAFCADPKEKSLDAIVKVLI